MSFSLKAVFGIDTTGVKTELRQLRRELNSFVSDAARLGAGVAIGAFVALSKGALDLASNLKDASGQIGINVESLQALHYAAMQNGSSVESMNKALEKLRLNTQSAFEGNEQYSGALAKLGLRAQQIVGLPLEKKYELIALAVKNSADKAAAYNAVSELFGAKIGPNQIKVLEALANDGFPKTAKAAAAAGHVMSAETIVALERAEQAIDDFKKRAIVAVGNIIVNFRSEEGAKLMLFHLLRAAGGFAARIFDFIVEGNEMILRIWGATMKGVANLFRDAFLTQVAFVGKMLNKILPEKFQINVEGIEALKSTGGSIADGIRRAIAETKPSTFAKDVTEYWDKAIAAQKTVVDQLNKTELKKDAAELRNAGKVIEASGARAGEALTKGAEKVEKAAEAMTIAFGREGRDNSELSDRELARKAQGLRQQLFQTMLRDQSPEGMAMFDSTLVTSLDPLKFLKQQELASALAEMNTRQTIRRNADFYGEDAAFRMAGPISEQRFNDILRGTNETVAALRDIQNTLKNRGIKTIPITT